MAKSYFRSQRSPLPSFNVLGFSLASLLSAVWNAVSFPFPVPFCAPEKNSGLIAFNLVHTHVFRKSARIRQLPRDGDWRFFFFFFKRRRAGRVGGTGAARYVSKPSSHPLPPPLSLPPKHHSSQLTGTLNTDYVSSFHSLAEGRIGWGLRGNERIRGGALQVLKKPPRKFFFLQSLGARLNHVHILYDKIPLGPYSKLLFSKGLHRINPPLPSPFSKSPPPLYFQNYIPTHLRSVLLMPSFSLSNSPPPPPSSPNLTPCFIADHLRSNQYTPPTVVKRVPRARAPWLCEYTDGCRRRERGDGNGDGGWLAVGRRYVLMQTVS